MYGVDFCHGSRLFEKTEFRQKRKFRKKLLFFVQKKLIFLSFGDIFIFPNACAIQTNLGTKVLLRKNCAREYGLLAKRIRKLKKGMLP